MKQKQQFGFAVVKSKNRFLFFALVIGGIALGVFVLGMGARFWYQSQKNALKTEDLTSLWQNAEYQEVYTLSNNILEIEPLNQTALVYHSYASFYLAISQTETTEALVYIDEAINSLRQALVVALPIQKNLLGQIYYMLAKSYFQKNAFASYNSYSDLVIHYLQKAKELGYVEQDMAEYLGLTYASLGMTDESIDAFTEALKVRESDVLLNAIGEQYFIAGNSARAKQYFFKVITDSKDELLVLKSKSILGKIYLEENNVLEAKRTFESILQKDASYADAYYGLGVVYEKQGDLIKARSEWRKALQMQIDHPEALQKLSN